MNVRINLMLWCLLLVASLTTLTGCSKDDPEPIQLYYGIYNDKADPVEGNRIQILFPASNKIQLLIFGGDGDYAIHNSDDAVVDVVVEGRNISITPLSTGSSAVTITDQSGGSYILNIEVSYRELNLIIEKQDVIVIGEKLSERQKLEIQHKASLFFPVKEMGGFSFVYDLSTHEGHVLIYKEKYGEKGVESVFEEKYTETASVGYRSYEFQIDGEKREFILNQYHAPMSKSSMIVPMAFIEVLTDRFKADYPDVESVFTQQKLVFLQ